MPSQIAALALAYIELMTQLGDPSHQVNLEQALPVLFSESIQKIENGTVIVSNEKDLQKQLTNARAFAAPWKIKTNDVVVNEAQKTAAINFSWTSEKMGPHITTVIIKFDKNDKIYQLNEVYNSTQGIMNPDLSSSKKSSK